MTRFVARGPLGSEVPLTSGMTMTSASGRLHRLRLLSTSAASTIDRITQLDLGFATNARRTTVRIHGGYSPKVWLGGPGIRLPIPAVIQAADGEVVAAIPIPQIAIFGVGSTPVEALEDLRSSLREHLEVLDAEERLSDDLSAQRSFLRLHLAA